MAYFAELDASNTVLRVIAVSNDKIKDEHGVEQESIGIAFCQELCGAGTNWKQTSYNNSFRVRYAGVGYAYNEILNAFIAPKPYPSWILNQVTTDWESPIGNAPELTPTQKEEGYLYQWNEDAQQWDLVPPIPRSS